MLVRKFAWEFQEAIEEEEKAREHTHRIRYCTVLYYCTVHDFYDSYASCSVLKNQSMDTWNHLEIRREVLGGGGGRPLRGIDRVAVTRKNSCSYLPNVMSQVFPFQVTGRIIVSFYSVSVA